jgi:hypothetical protein
MRSKVKYINMLQTDHDDHHDFVGRGWVFGRLSVGRLIIHVVHIYMVYTNTYIYIYIYIYIYRQQHGMGLERACEKAQRLRHKNARREHGVGGPKHAFALAFERRVERFEAAGKERVDT